MDVLIGFGGVFLGWLLAAITDSRRRRREGLTAARLIAEELRDNLGFLKLVVDSDGDVPLDSPPRRSTWDAYGSALLAVTDEETTWAIADAYRASDRAYMVIRYVKTGRDKLGAEVEAWSPSPQSAQEEAERRATIASLKGLRKMLAETAQTVGADDVATVEAALARVDRRAYPKHVPSST